MTDKLAAAKALALRGFRVFPLVENGKLPAIQGWPTKATTDDATIERWFGPDPHTGWTTDFNIGVATGGDLAVLDVDNKNGVNGYETLEALCVIEDAPRTFTVRTPTGGRHQYLAVTAEVRNSAAKIGPGLDIRGHHGFVVAPGSTIQDQAYTIEHDAPIAKCPAWLEALFQKATPRKEPNEAKAKIELDKPAALKRAAAHLSQAEPAVEGAGGDHHTFRVICQVKDLGISQPGALELLLDHWNDRCAPPWQPDDLERKVANAYQYGSEPVGISDPAMDFEFTPAHRDGTKLFFELPQDITAEQNTVPLVDGYIMESSVAVLYGQTNIGKSFVALDLAYHVAQGRPWLGETTKQGAVLYVSAEGGGGIRKRIVALKQHFGAASFPFALVPCPFTFAGKKETEDLVTVIDQASLALKQPVVLVVIDTVAQALLGDENSFEDMNRFIRCVYAVRNKTNAAVLLVHHTGKDEARGARGHSALKAAADTELEVSRGKLKVTKQRDAEYAAERHFALKALVVGEAPGGKSITSCVVEWHAGGSEFDPTPATPEEEGCLDGLKVAGGEEGTGASTSEVHTAYLTMKPEVPKRTILKWLVSLETKGTVRRIGGTKDTRWVLS